MPPAGTQRIRSVVCERATAENASIDQQVPILVPAPTRMPTRLVERPELMAGLTAFFYCVGHFLKQVFTWPLHTNKLRTLLKHGGYLLSLHVVHAACCAPTAMGHMADYGSPISTKAHTHSLFLILFMTRARHHLCPPTFIRV